MNSNWVRYNTVLSQTLSPCNRYLFAGNIFGEIAIISIRAMLKSRTPKGYIKVDKDSQVCSLLTTKEFLVAGTHGKLFGWRWHDILSEEDPNEAWTIEIPKNEKLGEKTDINSLTLLNDEDNDVIVVGCGDNNLYAFSLESGNLVRRYTGHQDYVHTVKYDNNNNQIVSCSEDGSIMMWDTRSRIKCNQILPYTNQSIQRSHLGKWVGDIDIKDNWLLCGGGVKMSLWHLKTLQPLTVFNDTFDSGIHVTKLIDEGVIGAGFMRSAMCSKINNSLVSQLNTSSSCVYSFVYRTSPSPVLTFAGDSNNIDFGTNFNFTDSALPFYD